MKTLRQSSGFTLIEILITLALFATVLISIYTLFDSTAGTYGSGTRRANVQQNARFSMEELAQRIRMAGYVPENFDDATEVPPGANNIPNPLAVHVGTADRLVLFGALGGVQGAGASRVYLYCRVGTDLIGKEGPLGNANSYTCDGTSYPAQNVFAGVVAQNVSMFTIRYFGGTDGSEIVGATQPPDPNVPSLDKAKLTVVPDLANTVQRAAIRTISITMEFQEAVVGRNDQRYRMASTIRLRNQ